MCSRSENSRALTYQYFYQYDNNNNGGIGATNDDDVLAHADHTDEAMEENVSSSSHTAMIPSYLRRNGRGIGQLSSSRTPLQVGGTGGGGEENNNNISTSSSSSSSPPSDIIPPSITSDGKSLHDQTNPTTMGLTPAQAAAVTPLQKNNLGFRMLQGMGWKENTGLGKQRTGRIEPVRGVLVVLHRYASVCKLVHCI